jgi:membrane-bound serine protease (ClpP class)
MKTLFTVFVLLLDEIAVVALVFVVLWRMGVDLSPGLVAGVTVGVAALVLIVYRLVAPVLKRKPLTGREGMIGLEGKAITQLTEDGLVRVAGELWNASSSDALAIPAGEAVVVLQVEGLRLLVRRKSDG